MRRYQRNGAPHKRWGDEAHYGLCAANAFTSSSSSLVAIVHPLSARRGRGVVNGATRTSGATRMKAALTVHGQATPMQDSKVILPGELGPKAGNQNIRIQRKLRTILARRSGGGVSDSDVGPTA